MVPNSALYQMQSLEKNLVSRFPSLVSNPAIMLTDKNQYVDKDNQNLVLNSIVKKIQRRVVLIENINHIK